MFSPKNTYTKVDVSDWPIPNSWDVLALLLVFVLLGLLGWGAKAMVGEYHLGEVMHISLQPWHLPYYGLCTFLRMLMALIVSLLFTFVFGTWAAKSPRAERVIIPFIDIMQSVPVLGFLSVTVVGFIVLFEGSRLGPEAAAIFAIFTAQVWNMVLSFYQSLKTVPREMREAASVFQLSPWQCFWRLEVPFAMPGLLWNTMMSMSASWVFLVAAEAFSVGQYKVTLPGIGSYINLAIQQRSVASIAWVIVAMLVVIGIYDQLMFRPLIAWAEKFKMDEVGDEEEPESWLLDLFQSTRFFQFVGEQLRRFGDAFVNCRLFRRTGRYTRWAVPLSVALLCRLLWMLVVTVALGGLLYLGVRFMAQSITWAVCEHVLYLGLITTVRVMVIVVLCSFVWVPVGVMIGRSAKASRVVQPIVQFLAAFPANLLFPLVVISIVRYRLNVDIWTSPLMALGTQWYILFNVIAGTRALPKHMHQAVGTLNVRGWLWWRRFILPGIFPYYITGAITAAGGAWNYSIIVEAVSWGATTLYATGLGAYITRAYTAGQYPELVLGIVVMSLLVLVINRLFWRPLYLLAQRRFQI